MRSSPRPKLHSPLRKTSDHSRALIVVVDMDEEYVEKGPMNKGGR